MLFRLKETESDCNLSGGAVVDEVRERDEEFSKINDFVVIGIKEREKSL